MVIHKNTDATDFRKMEKSVASVLLCCSVYDDTS